MPETEKRSVGRPRKEAQRVSISISLAPEIVRALSAVCGNSRGAFIEACLRANPQIATQLAREHQS